MKLLTYEEAAELLRISPVTLRKKVMRGEIAHYKPFGPRSRVFFTEDDLENLLLASRHGGDKK